MIRVMVDLDLGWDARQHAHMQSHKHSHLGVIWCNQSTYQHVSERWEETRELRRTPQGQHEQRLHRDSNLISGSNQ